MKILLRLFGPHLSSRNVRVSPTKQTTPTAVTFPRIPFPQKEATTCPHMPRRRKSSYKAPAQRMRQLRFNLGSKKQRGRGDSTTADLPGDWHPERNCLANRYPTGFKHCNRSGRNHSKSAGVPIIKILRRSPFSEVVQITRVAKSGVHAEFTNNSSGTRCA